MCAGQLLLTLTTTISMLGIVMVIVGKHRVECCFAVEYLTADGGATENRKKMLYRISVL